MGRLLTELTLGDSKKEKVGGDFLFIYFVHENIQRLKYASYSSLWKNNLSPFPGVTPF